MSEVAPVVVDAPADPTPDPTPAAPEAPPADPPTADPAAPDTPAVEPEGLDALPPSWQKEIRDLRAEAAKHRTSAAAAKPVAEVFGMFDSDSQARLVDLLKLTATDGKAAAAAWREIADLLEGAPAEPPAADPDADRPMTRAEYDQIKKEEADRAATDAAQAAIQQEAADLGYTPGTGDYVTLLWSASNEHGGDLKKAHEAREARDRQIIEDYLAKKKADAEATPTAGSGTGAAPANENPPRSFADAKASVEERIRAARG